MIAALDKVLYSFVWTMCILLVVVLFQFAPGAGHVSQILGGQFGQLAGRFSWSFYLIHRLAGCVAVPTQFPIGMGVRTVFACETLRFSAAVVCAMAFDEAVKRVTIALQYILIARDHKNYDTISQLI